MIGANTDWAAGAAWMEGKIVPIEQASICVLDWGLTHSDITYDVVHVWNGRFFRLNDYLDRFELSIGKLRLSVDQSREDMRRIVHEIVARSGLKESYVSLVASRGQPIVPGTRDPRYCKNHFYAWCVPFVWVFQPEVIERGAHLYLSNSVERIGTKSVDPTAKNYHWGDFTSGLFEAKEAGFDSVLLADAEGNITEGPGYNLFIVKDGLLKTPPHGVLEGLTRRTAMEIAESIQLNVEAANFDVEDLLEADEVFVTTTGGGIVPVTRINDRIFSNGAPGNITREISETYWKWHEKEEFSEAVNYS
ncbi:MAG: aminotransferase class IV [Pseudomonadota bacterium]